MAAETLSVTNFAVQYSGVTAADILASDHDLVIVEAKPLTTGPDLTDAEVATIIAADKVVIGYVSVGQTDDARPYWDPSWTDDGTDTGNPTFEAPDWLAEKADSWPAAIVEYWSDDWKDIVLAQVTELATRGYSGVFLDNILSYYEIADLRGELGTAQSQFYASEMMQLVVDIAAAGRAVNPDFAVIANGGPYVIGDAGAFGTPLATAYLDAVDGIMAESFFGLLGNGRQEGTLDVFETFWAAQGIDVLALEYSTDDAAIDAYVTEAVARGFAVSVSPDQALNVLPDALVGIDAPVDEDSLIEGTTAADKLAGTGLDDTIKGFAGADEMRGRDGDDQLFGGAGRDFLAGNEGADVLKGQNGGDTLLGGNGNDQIYGGDGDDQLVGGAGRDDMRGGKGADLLKGGTKADDLNGGAGGDVLRGGAGADVLTGGRGNDDLFGGGGADTFVFDRQGDDFIGDFTLELDMLEVASTQGLSVEAVTGGAQIIASDGASLEFAGLTVAEVETLLGF